MLATFKSIRPLKVLDLSQNLRIPSLFDSKNNKQRYIIKFLKNFIADFSKPIDRDDKAHIEYVPTQIVTEFFRHVFLDSDNRRLDGIIYPSAKNTGKEAIVIFAEHSQCIDSKQERGDESLMELVNCEAIVPDPFINKP